MSKASEGQARSLIASFAVDTPWEEIETDTQPFIELTPKERGERFAAFVRNGFRLIVSGLKAVIDRTKSFDPTFIGAGWTIWKGPATGDGLNGNEEQDTRSLALAEVDVNQIRLVTTLKGRESSIKGEERLNRLQATGHIRLDAAVFLFLWLNQHLIPESWKERVNGNIQFITFDGTVLRNSNGYRYVLCLYWYGGEWYWHVNWLDFDFVQDYVSAVLAS
ncbi:MAG TPA: hypothetical protein VJG67_03450 [Candidatus Paceibacterota bacterium]